MAQNNNNEINNIEVIREINDRYIVIKYFDAEVIYDKETKFINATKLCQHISKVTGKQKKFYHWMELKQTQKFIKDMIKNINKSPAAQKQATGKPTENNNNSPAPGIPGTENQDNQTENSVPGIPGTENLENNKISYVITAAHNSVSEIRGTYLHLDLIPQLCNWASKEYAFKISYIINYINGIKDYDSAYSKLKNDKLKAKDNELESKTEEIKKIEEEHQKQLKAKDEELKAKEKELKKAKKELKESEKKNEKKTIIIKKKDEKVKELKEEIKGKTEELEDLRKTKSEDDIEIKKLKKDIEFKVFNKYQTYNSVIKYNEAIKEYKEAGFITTKRNYITLKNISLDEFIEKIKETI